MSTRVRFAPSPTGEIHIGNIRTALFNYLFARKTKGTFILRIEDTDQKRSTQEFEEIILNEMKWLGLDFDEGVGVGGEKGPYRQSQRLSYYQEYVQRLLVTNKAYPCFCSPEDIQKMRQEALAKGEMPRYNQRCRQLTLEDIQKFEAGGRRPVIRFLLPSIEETLLVRDLIRGSVEFKSSVLDDFVIQKSDGMPTYNFAVVVDDALMEITHVIRGEDHLSNTPKQILLYRALGFPKPQFAHLSMILDQDRKKLSKRSDDAYVFVSQYRNKGYLPEAMVNFLALLGWSSPDGEDVISKEAMIDGFSLEGINRSPAIFDLKKLNWLNGVYIRRLSKEEFLPLLKPYLEKEISSLGPDSDTFLADVASLFQESLENLSQIKEVSAFIFQRPERKKDILLNEKQKEAFLTIIDTLEGVDNWDLLEIKDILGMAMKDLPIKGKALYHPLRYALTGKESGPDLYKIVYLLRKEEVFARLREVLSFRI